MGMIGASVMNYKMNKSGFGKSNALPIYGVVDKKTVKVNGKIGGKHEKVVEKNGHIKEKDTEMIELGHD